MFEKLKWGSTHNPKCGARIQNSGVRNQNSCVRFADICNLLVYYLCCAGVSGLMLFSLMITTMPAQQALAASTAATATATATTTAVGTDPANPGDWKLSISNTVDGPLSNQSSYFEFNITLIAPDNVDPAIPYTAYVVEFASHDPTKTYRVSADPAANGADSNGKIMFVSGQNKTFLLKHDQILVFLDLPVGATFTVMELKNESYIPDASVTCDGVQLGFEYRAESTDLIIPHISNIVFKEPLYTGPGANNVDFLNTREEVVSTGLNLSPLPFIGLMTLALGALISYIALKLNHNQSFTR